MSSTFLFFSELLDGLTFGTDIHIPLRMNWNNFDDPLTSSLIKWYSLPAIHMHVSIFIVSIAC